MYTISINARHSTKIKILFEKWFFLEKKYSVIKCKTKFSALHEFLSCTTEINFTQRTLPCIGYFMIWKKGTGLCNPIYFEGIDYIYMESYEFLKKWRDYLNKIGIFRSSKQKKKKKIHNRKKNYSIPLWSKIKILFYFFLVSFFFLIIIQTYFFNTYFLLYLLSKHFKTIIKSTFLANVFRTTVIILIKIFNFRFIFIFKKLSLWLLLPPHTQIYIQCK